MRVRERKFLSDNTDKIGTSWTEIGGVKSQIVDYHTSSPLSETCIDELHKMIRTRSGSKRWDRGGPLHLKRAKVTRKNSKTLNLSNGAYRYSGTLACTYSLGANPSLGAHLDDLTSLSAIGTTGIARCRPGNPVMGLGQAIGEIHQLPSIPNLKKAIGSLRGLGKQYLNAEFGWKPLLKDVNDLLNSTEIIDKAFNQLRRDNGRLIRRRCVVSRTDTTTVSKDTGINGTYPNLHNFLYANVPIAQRFKRMTFVKTGGTYWFAGAFRYWIPNIEDPWRARLAKAHLAGVIPTPELVWNLIPWSWLIDWFTNVGDVMTNISANAASNLVMPYGYAMGRKWSETSRYASARMWNAGWVTTESHIRKDLKRRERATAFGFGIDEVDFSVRQLAILAALGLSRSKGLG